MKYLTILIFLLIILGAWFYIGKSITGSTVIEKTGGNLTLPIINLSKKYEGYYWDHMPLSYNYSNIDNCYPIKILMTQRALREIEEKTERQVSFSFNEDKADITFLCSKNSNMGREMETLGEADVEYNLDAKKINHAKINLYGGVKEGCDYPDVEIHELLHVLGEEHNTHSQSVMNVIQQRCLKETNMDVDGVIFERLKSFY